MAVELNLAKLAMDLLPVRSQKQNKSKMSARFFIFEIGRWVGQLCYLANDAFVSHEQNVIIKPDFIDSIMDAMVKVLFNVLQLSKYMNFTLQDCVREKIILNGKKYPVVASKVSRTI